MKEKSPRKKNRLESLSILLSALLFGCGETPAQTPGRGGCARSQIYFSQLAPDIFMMVVDSNGNTIPNVVVTVADGLATEVTLSPDSERNFCSDPNQCAYYPFAYTGNFSNDRFVVTVSAPGYVTQVHRLSYDPNLIPCIPSIVKETEFVLLPSE